MYVCINFRYQFPPIDPIWHKLLGFFMFIVGVLSFFGNGLVVYIFTTTRSLRTPSNLLVVNLAFSDFCMMLCMSPAMVYNCIHETWALGKNQLMLGTYYVYFLKLNLIKSKDNQIPHLWLCRIDYYMSAYS